jgi:ABC-2 type transport system permease protein
MKTLSSFAQIYRQTASHFFVPFRWKNYFPFTALILLGGTLLWLEVVGFTRVFDAMYKFKDFPFFFVQALLERLIGLIFLISYSMIFMSSMINGLSTFYLSAELPFLHTLPIPRWKILALRFVENWATSCYMVVFFLAAFLYAHAISFHFGWRQIVSSLILVVLFTLSPVALGSAAVTLLVRFFPVRRIHQVVTLMAGIFLGTLVIAVRMMKPERLLSPTDTDDFSRLIQDLTLPSINHLPSTWAAKVLVYGDLQSFAALLVLAIACTLIMAVLLYRFYGAAFVYSQESRSLRGNRKVAKNRSRVRTGVASSLIRKDLKLFLRDATQWSQLLLLFALVAVYLLNIKNLSGQLPMVSWIVSFINLGLAGFVLAALSVRFLFPSVSIEGRAFWILRTMPVSIREVLWCKYLIYFPPFLIFTQALVYFSNRILQVPEYFLYMSAANIFAVSMALTGLAIGIGALMPNFKSDHPSKIAVGPGGVLYMLLSFVYLAIMLAIQIRPVWYFVLHRSAQLHNEYYAAAGIALTLIITLVPMEWGARRLARMEGI